MILGSCVPEQGIGQKYMNSSKETLLRKDTPPREGTKWPEQRAFSR